jgi:diguanylate cyclase (GGDEF)-like protein
VTAHSWNILIIDDEPGNRDAYQKILQKAGFETKSIATESEALAVMADRDFDAVIIDLRIPGHGLIDLAEKIKKSCPSCAVFLLTNEFAPAFLKKAIEVGVENCLNKPFLPSILSESVRKSLERVTLAREKERLDQELLLLREGYDFLSSKYEKLNRQIIFDPLTGLLKQEFFIERLEYEIKRVKRHEHCLSLFLLQLPSDLNMHNEKETLGVDRAHFITTAIRSIDIVSLYKEGVAIILPETNDQGALTFQERMKQNIAESNSLFSTITNREKDSSLSELKKNITCACATYPIDSHLPKRLLRIAESRLR